MRLTKKLVNFLLNDRLVYEQQSYLIGELRKNELMLQRQHKPHKEHMQILFRWQTDHSVTKQLSRICMFLKSRQDET